MLSSMRKNPLEKKPYPPGEHGRGRHRQTEFGLRLMEKQKARWYYGVSEKQFRRAYDRATRMQGVSGENLLRLMELRMDNVVYRMGFSTSRPQARQLVVHGHFQLNGRKHNVPSAILKPGDVITVKEKSRDLEPIQNAVENVVAVPPWLRGRPRQLHGQDSCIRRGATRSTRPSKSSSSSSSTAGSNRTFLAGDTLTMLDIAPPRFRVEEEEGRRGTFVAEPLPRGLGHTLGNSLRRVMLSGLTGAAVTKIRIEGVSHEFSTIEGVKEDVVDIILNIKGLKFKLEREEPIELSIAKDGPGDVTAADIELKADVEVVDPEAYIASVSDGGHLDMRLTVERGQGYARAEQNKSEADPIGVIAVDSLFSPVQRVNYTVTETRAGARADLDSLRMEVFTDGRIEPQEALQECLKATHGLPRAVHRRLPGGRAPPTPASAAEGL